VPQLELNGTTLHYHESGDGEPLVLVHGSASDVRTWAERQPVLAKRFRTIAYSRRYHPPNPRIEEGVDYSMPEHVDDLRALLASHVGGSAHLVGHSYGAFLCLLLAIREPGLARTLVLAEPPVVPLVVPMPPGPLGLARLLVTDPRTALAVLKFVASGVLPAARAFQRGDREAALQHFGPATLGREAFEGLSDERLQQARDNLIAMELLGSGFAPIEADDVRSVRTPSLLLSGTRSPGLFRRLCDRLEGLLPDVERVTLAGASHIGHEDAPEAWDTAVLSFLDRRGRDGTPG
jgi:pimeloyl-ACP methyl ester carboxylesterase